MDGSTVGAVVAIIKGIFASDVERAETAAENAEASAEIAETAAAQASSHNYGITITDTTLNIIEEEEVGE